MDGDIPDRSVAAGPAIILVEPQLGENIGMVARAMANFGLSELRLVNPRDGWPSDKARAAASRADHVIDGAVLFDDLRSALADLNFVYATTARERDGFKQVRGPSRRAGRCGRAPAPASAPASCSGASASASYNEEVALADEIVTFPVNPDFASLNIAQAVLLMSYEWMKSGLENETDTAFHRSGRGARPRRHICTACSSIWKRRSTRAAISVRRPRSRRCWTICAPC